MFFVVVAEVFGGVGPETGGAGEESVDSLLVDKFANPLAVYPEKFDFVVASARVLDAVEGEFFNQFFFGVDFLFSAVVPAEAGEVVEHGFGEDAVVAIFGDGFGAVALTEFFVAGGS